VRLEFDTTDVSPGPACADCGTDLGAVARGGYAGHVCIGVNPGEPAPDGLAAVLDIAAEVALENEPDPGMTRVERLARFVRANFADAAFARSQAGAVSVSSVTAASRPDDPFGYGRVEVQRVGSLMAIRTRTSPTDASKFVPLTPALARALATALLIEAEDHERATRVAPPAPPVQARTCVERLDPNTPAFACVGATHAERPDPGAPAFAVAPKGTALPYRGEF